MPVSHVARSQFPLEAAIITFADRLDKDPDTKTLVAMRMMREFADIKSRADANVSETSYAYDNRDDVKDWAGWMSNDLKKAGLNDVQVSQAVEALTDAAVKHGRLGTAREEYQGRE